MNKWIVLALKVFVFTCAVVHIDRHTHWVQTGILLSGRDDGNEVNSEAIILCVFKSCMELQLESAKGESRSTGKNR